MGHQRPTQSSKLSYSRCGLSIILSSVNEQSACGRLHLKAALNFRTGKTVWEIKAGAGHTEWDPGWPGLAVGPNETLYLGLVAIRDGV